MQTSETPQSSEMKRLVRPIKGRVLAGVSLGIANYLHTDPVVVRLLLAFLIIFTGVFPGVLLYLVAWIIMPEGN
jgi:phage shock protein C